MSKEKVTKMAGIAGVDKTPKQRFWELIEDTLRTDPFRKAESAMVSVMLRHGLVPPSSFEPKQNCAPPEYGYKEWTENNPNSNEKECWLSQASHAIQSSQLKLELLSADYQNICLLLASAIDDEDSNHNSPSKVPIATLSQHLTLIVSQMVEMSRPLFDTTLGLHSLENFFRNTEDLSELDFTPKGRVRLPPYKANETAVMGLNFCRTKAEEAFASFKKSFPEEQKMQEILQLLLMATEDFQLGAHKSCIVYENILYLDDQGKKFLQNYADAIGFLERTDIIMESQALRRSIDEIMILLERLSLISFLTFSKIAGNYEYVSSLTENPMKMGAKLLPLASEVGKKGSKIDATKKDSKQNASRRESKQETSEKYYNEVGGGKPSKSKQQSEPEFYKELANNKSTSKKKVGLKGIKTGSSNTKSQVPAGASKSRSSSQTRKKPNSKKK